MNVLDCIRIPKSGEDSIVLILPGRTLFCDRVDFTTGSLVFRESDFPAHREIKRYVPASQGVNETLGLAQAGHLAKMHVARPLADLLALTSKHYLSGLPITLMGDGWYLVSKQWGGVQLCNGTHLVEWCGKGVRVVPSRTRRRPIVLDPLGMSKSGQPLFPLSRAVDLLVAQAGVLADPYAWRKQSLPRGGKSINILVVGPKS
jgi:hypothetical protein